MAEKWIEKWRKIEGATCLPYTLQVIIPHTCKPDCAKAFRELRHNMTSLFGGSTTYDAEGLWIDDAGKEVPDKVKVIESAHSCMTPSMETEFERMVYRAAQIARQDAISIKQGKFLILPTKKKP